LTDKLEDERAEVRRLKEEESAWLERGINAEFEKKDEVMFFLQQK